VAVDYAVAVHRGDWADADLHDLADDVLVPLARIRTSGTGDRPPTGRPLRVRGAVTSAVHREPGGLVVRVYNPAPTAGTVEIERDETPARGWLVDLRGRPVERFEGSFELRAAGIATARLDP
jgi:hypothetical protein